MYIARCIQVMFNLVKTCEKLGMNKAYYVLGGFCLFITTKSSSCISS